MSAEAKYAGIGMVLIEGNKQAFRRPLDKVIITYYTRNSNEERDAQENPEYNTN